MYITTINIAREGFISPLYSRADPTKPFVAKIGIQSQTGEMVLHLSPEVSGRVMALIADEVAAAGRAAAEAMTAECFMTALPAQPAAAAELEMPF